MRRNSWAPRAQKFVTIFVFSVFMVGCASSVTLDIAYHPAKVGQSWPAGFPARRILLGHFSDPGGSTTFIGQRKAAFETPMGNVFATRQPGVVVRDAVAAELRRNGHTLVDTNPVPLCVGE